jgi:hypothetical protein
MKLDDYVNGTLMEITNGVAAAQEEALLYIAPGYVNGIKQEEAQMVAFEVGLTVSKEMGGGISVFSIGDAKAGASSEQVNRVSFSIPVYFQAPTEKNPKHHMRLTESDVAE